MSGSPGLAAEMARKSVHVAMGGFALGLRWLGPWWSAALAIAALLFNLFVLHPLTGRALLRKGERERGFSLGIALYPAVVLALVVVFHARLELAAATWALLAFGDGMATVAGVLLRGPALPWNPGKTWSGFVTFVLYGTATAAFLIRWTQRAAVDGVHLDNGPVDWVGFSFFASGPGASSTTFLLVGCLVAAVAAGFAESLDTGVDDNILVPLVGGGVLYLATLFDGGLWGAASGELLGALPWALGINLALAILAYVARGVGVSGAFWGAVLGSVLFTFAGWQGFSMLLLFFVLGTACTKFGSAKKRSLGIAQEKGGRRGAKNAFANTGTGVVCAILAVVTPFREVGLLALAAAFATATFDTVSSEIGQALGRRHHLITTFRRVPAGTDGAVSIEGTLAGFVGAAILAAAAWGTGLVTPAGALIVVAAAFVGATAESYLGALVKGAKKVDNELINFTNTAIGAAVAVLLAGP